MLHTTESNFPDLYSLGYCIFLCPFNILIAVTATLPLDKQRRVTIGTEKVIGEEQCGFRRGRGCVDKIFVVRQECKKYLEKGKDVF